MSWGTHSALFWATMPALGAVWLTLYIIASVKSYRKGNQS